MSEHHPPLDDDSNLVQDLNVEKQQLDLTQLLVQTVPLICADIVIIPNLTKVAKI